MNAQPEEPSLADLQARVTRFVEERDWREFHSPKNLAQSIAIEAAELMEHFQWLTVAQSRELVRDAHARRAIALELADILIYALSFAEAAGMDPSAAVLDKLAQNERRFPPDVVRGAFGTRPGGGHTAHHTPPEIEDDMLPEYDRVELLKGGVRSKYAERYREGTNIVRLAPDVALAFPNEEAVNDALRLVMKMAQLPVRVPQE
ncbi:MAG: nucleotide pyrophosphohydrolase [Ardenticatenaceae bacterium]